MKAAAIRVRTARVEYLPRGWISEVTLRIKACHLSVRGHEIALIRCEIQITPIETATDEAFAGQVHARGIKDGPALGRVKWRAGVVARHLTVMFAAEERHKIEIAAIEQAIDESTAARIDLRRIETRPRSGI